MNRIELLYQQYATMMGSVITKPLLSETEFKKRFMPKLEEMHLIELNPSNADDGFLYYTIWTDEATHCYVPVYGYYAENEKKMDRLFQKLAETIVSDGVYDFSVNLYSGDVACQTALHMMQFGNMAEKCIKSLDDADTSCESYEIKALTKEEIRKNWKEIWGATENIVEHLRHSPVFYPGNEFTEEVYWNYYLSDSLELIASYDHGTIAGIIEWNTEYCELIGEEGQSVNVGEAFVYPEHRGTGLAEKLLRYAEARAILAGYQYMWVEHGTANPNARGFWNKYFATYQYELVRRIG